MRPNRLIGGIAQLALILFLLPLSVSAQDGLILANEIRVTPQEATLSLELVDNTTLSISFRDGRVLSNGVSLGTFTPGGELDQAWRGLLGQALIAEPSAIANLLRAWTPPRSLAGGETASATALTGTLVRMLEADLEPQGLRGTTSGDEPLVQFLLENPDAAARLAQLLDGRSARDLQWWVGGDRTLPEGTRLDGNLAVLRGNLELNGILGGDLLVFQGDVRLGSGARVEGDLRIDGGLIRGSTQGVQGRVQRIPQGTTIQEEVSATDTRDTASSIVLDFRRGFEAGWDAGGERSGSRSRAKGPFLEFLNGLGNLLRTGVSFLILLGMGLGALYFFPRPFDVVTRTCQASFWRSLLVGWAALVLSPFVWITGLLLLVVTIIGIPFALLWIPVFWMALAVSILFGTLAASRMLGAWWVGQARLPIPRGMDREKPAVQLGLGAILLLAAAAASAVFQMGGSLFQIFHVLFAILGGVIVANVMALGLGAVLLSRAGRDSRWSQGIEDLTPAEDEELFAAEGTPASETGNA